MEQLKSRIEAVLFVTAKVLQVNEIAEILEESPENVEEALLELIMDYASRDGALEIDDENGYILQVKEGFYRNFLVTLISLGLGLGIGAIVANNRKFSFRDR